MRLLAAGKYKFLPGMTEDWDTVPAGEIPPWWDFDVPNWNTINLIETKKLEWPPGSGKIYHVDKPPKSATTVTPDSSALGWMEILAICMAAAAGVAGVGVLVQALIQSRVSRLARRRGPGVEMGGIDTDDDPDDDDFGAGPVHDSPNVDTYSSVPNRSRPPSRGASDTAEIQQRIGEMTLDHLASKLSGLGVKDTYFRPVFPFGSRIDALVEGEVPINVIFADHPDDCWDFLPLDVKRYYLENPKGSDVADYLVEVAGGKKVVERKLAVDPNWSLDLEPYAPDAATIEELKKRRELEAAIQDLKTTKLESELKKIKAENDRVDVEIKLKEKLLKQAKEELESENTTTGASSSDKSAVEDYTKTHNEKLYRLEEKKAAAEERLAQAQIRNMETPIERWSGHAMNALSTVTGFGMMGRLSRPSTPQPLMRPSSTSRLSSITNRGRTLGGSKSLPKSRARPRPGR
jgi:hypothetical protein